MNNLPIEEKPKTPPDSLSENEKSLIYCIRKLQWGTLELLVKDGKPILIKQSLKTIKLSTTRDIFVDRGRIENMDSLFWCEKRLVHEIRRMIWSYPEILVQRGRPEMLRLPTGQIKLIDTRSGT